MTTRRLDRRGCDQQLAAILFATLVCSPCSTNSLSAGENATVTSCQSGLVRPEPSRGQSARTHVVGLGCSAVESRKEEARDPLDGDKCVISQTVNKVFGLIEEKREKERKKKPSQPELNNGSNWSLVSTTSSTTPTLLFSWWSAKQASTGQ
ncbi:hypothetical protein BD289DRAFT_137320 [Coniella lustricola]|uniref:Uncharacterized protein n=1 Tax=Coniella lustricola TaxID=2025994 RepID=A0A2T2ZVK9_9PEZI|nr:hypothetical protein BD289DRAFT_137320 [Coniella lustricola]